MNVTQNQNNQQSLESGMTLVEVVLSTVILGVVLAALGQALTLGIKLNTESKMRVSSLNSCKHITESMKTEISQSQTVFDGTAGSTNTYYADTDGNKTLAFTGTTAFQVKVVVSDNNDLTQTVGGVTSVLVKTLSVTVVDVQNIGKPGRETIMNVEIIRPSA